MIAETLPNLAVRQPCWQSSEGWSGVCTRGIDGNDNSEWNGASCTHTQSEYHAWWAVDLGQSYEISSVTITNRNVLSMLFYDYMLQPHNFV